MMKTLLRALLVLSLATVPMLASAATVKPLVVNNGLAAKLNVNDVVDLTANPLMLNITGSAQCLHVGVTGLVSGTGSDCGSSGSGTVTHTVGALTSGQLIVGNGTADIKTGDLSGDVSTSGSGVTTIGANKVTLADVAQIGANTVLGNATASTANVAAQSMPSCSSASSALTWTTSSGFGCNTISSGANPTATASDTAVNGVATTFMRSDAAPPVQKATASVFGLMKPDGTTITAASGIATAVLPYGAYDLLGSVTTTAGQTTATFTSISGAYNNLRVVVFGASTLNSTTSSNALILQFNSDTGAHYQFSLWATFPPTTNTFQSANNTAAGFNAGLLVSGGAAANAGYFSFCIIDIYSYAQTNYYIPVRTTMTTQQNNVGLISEDGGGRWVPTARAAITRIDVTESAGLAFATGSAVLLYGQR